ncbi:APC family permease [Sphingobium sp. B2]|uniref:APC family permease n=1 Tax=Sphingobium sp. B2 TaxID=2583228 RepID=UPI0039658C34
MTSPSPAYPQGQSQTVVNDGTESLSNGVLGSVDITFMVLAVAAPMAIVVATMPLAFAFGNGVGVAGAYLLSAIAITLFAVGYVRIMPLIRNAGAFYAIISASFGRAAGLGSAYVAMLSYIGLCCATLGAFSFFATDMLHNIGMISVHWGVIAMFGIAALALLSWFRIDFTAKILAIALGAEVLAILLLDFAIIAEKGLIAPSIVLAPSVVFGPGLGVAAIYAFNSVIGFEATAIYQEEARDPARTVPRATYAAIAIVSTFYIFTAYAFTIAEGTDVARHAAIDPGHFVFGLAHRYLGEWGQILISSLVVTSAFAAILGLFNNGVRYVYALGRDRILPGALSRTRRSNGAPFVAGVPVVVILVLTVGGFAMAGLDPLLSLTTALTGFGSVGLMLLLCLTSFAVPAFFLQHNTRLSVPTAMPLLGGVMLAAGCGLSILNYPLLTGTDSRLINALPVALPIIFAAGVVQAAWMKRRHPAIYSRIGLSRTDV